MPQMKKTREGFGRALVELGRDNPDIVVLVGDLTDSTMVSFFAKEFPDRFIEMGVAEQNMMTAAAGLSLVGKIPFLATYGAFATCRCADQIRVTVCYSDLNVKIGGAHGGISVGPDGATHQALEEIAMMRVLPNMKVIVPCDFEETRKATLAAASIWGPVYIRFGREDVPCITDANTPFEIGKGNILRQGDDVAIVACGVMVHEALQAAETLAQKDVEARVIDLHTIKPIDRHLLIQAADDCGAVVTAEEHQIHGGLGSAVAEVLVRNRPVPMEFVAVDDRFGQSGNTVELMSVFGLTADHIVLAVNKAMARKTAKVY
jgi:transketolase